MPLKLSTLYQAQCTIKYTCLSIMLLFIISSHLHGMLWRLPSIEEKIADQYVQLFPLMTAEDANDTYNRKDIPDLARQKIDAYFTKKNNIVKKIFWVTVKMDPGLAENLMLKVFNNNKETRNMFLSLPLYNIPLLVWSQNVFDGDKSIASSFKILSPTLIFKLSEEIKRTEVIVENTKPFDPNAASFCVGKKDIEILRLLRNNANEESILRNGKVEFRYYYHKKYDPKDLMAIIRISTFCSIPIATTGLSRLIGAYYPENIISDYIKRNISFFIVAPAVGLFLSLFEKQDHLKYFFKWSSTWALGASILSFTFSCILPNNFVITYIALPTLIFATITKFMYEGKHYYWKSLPINWDKDNAYSIDKILKRPDTVIPEDSRIVYPQIVFPKAK